MIISAMLWQERHVLSIASSSCETDREEPIEKGKGKGNENRMPGEYSGRPSAGYG